MTTKRRSAGKHFPIAPAKPTNALATKAGFGYSLASNTNKSKILSSVCCSVAGCVLPLVDTSVSFICRIFLQLSNLPLRNSDLHAHVGPQLAKRGFEFLT